MIHIGTKFSGEGVVRNFKQRKRKIMGGLPIAVPANEQLGFSFPEPDVERIGGKGENAMPYIVPIKSFNFKEKKDIRAWGSYPENVVGSVVLYHGNRKLMTPTSVGNYGQKEDEGVLLLRQMSNDRKLCFTMGFGAWKFPRVWDLNGFCGILGGAGLNDWGVKKDNLEGFVLKLLDIGMLVSGIGLHGDSGHDEMVRALRAYGKDKGFCGEIYKRFERWFDFNPIGKRYHKGRMPMDSKIYFIPGKSFSAEIEHPGGAYMDGVLRSWESKGIL